LPNSVAFSIIIITCRADWETPSLLVICRMCVLCYLALTSTSALVELNYTFGVAC